LEIQGKHRSEDRADADLEHLRFFGSTGVQAYIENSAIYTLLVTNHWTGGQSNAIGRKKCRWQKFRHTVVRLYAGATEGT
jgi:hypothetical protein